MNRSTRAIVMTFLVIYGTFESIFWTRLLWAKFGPAPAREELDVDDNKKA